MQSKMYSSPNINSERNGISAFSLDQMIFNYPKGDSNPYFSTHSLIQKKGYTNNIKFIKKTPLSIFSTATEQQPQHTTTFHKNHQTNSNQDSQANAINIKSIPKFVLLNQRNYSPQEKEIMSNLNMDELATRSPGKGMYIKISKYRNIVRPNQFTLNEEDLFPSNYSKMRCESNSVKRQSNLVIEKAKYDRKQLFEKDNEQMMRYRAKMRQLEEAKNKLAVKTYDRVTNKNNSVGTRENILKDSIKEKMRDKGMIKLMMKYGEKQLMFRLINYRNPLNPNYNKAHY